MNHKLCNFILAQDKKAKKEAKKNGKDKKKNKDKKKDDSDDDKKKSKKDKKKDKKRDKKDKKSKSAAAADDSEKDYIKDALAGGKDDDDILGGEADETSVASEAGVDDEGAMLLAVEATRKYLVDNPDASADAIAELVTNQQMASALKAHDKIHILIRAAMTEEFFKTKEVQKYAPAVEAISNGNRIIERHLIAALEFVSMDKPKNFPVMLKQMYDEDALQEETILEWAEEGRSDFTLDAVDEDTRASLRANAEPVVVWLQEADSEDESEDE